MKIFKTVISIFLITLMLVSMSGCVTYGNKGIEDLTEEEISEAISIIEETKDQLEDELADMPELEQFTTNILDDINDAFEEE